MNECLSGVTQEVITVGFFCTIYKTQPESPMIHVNEIIDECRNIAA